MSNQYSDDTKAAVMAALLEGQSINQVARDVQAIRDATDGIKGL